MSLLCMPYIRFSPNFFSFLYKASNKTVLPAEEGCLQYYTGVSGQIKSYNYDPGAGLQLSKQDYSICIRMERNFCGIQYTTCPDTGRKKTDQPLHRGPSAAWWQIESLLHVGIYVFWNRALCYTYVTRTNKLHTFYSKCCNLMIVSSTCFEHPSVHNQEHLYMEFYGFSLVL